MGFGAPTVSLSLCLWTPMIIEASLANSGLSLAAVCPHEPLVGSSRGAPVPAGCYYGNLVTIQYS